MTGTQIKISGTKLGRFINIYGDMIWQNMTNNGTYLGLNRNWGLARFHENTQWFNLEWSERARDHLIHKSAPLHCLEGTKLSPNSTKSAMPASIELAYICIYIYSTIIHTLHYITLHCIALHCNALHYITLYYITLHTLHCIALHCIALHGITLHYITLHYITLHTLHCIALHCITLHYITPHTYILYIYTSIIFFYSAIGRGNDNYHWLHLTTTNMRYYFTHDYII